VFGMKTPPLIRTLDEVKIKVQLLDALTDIKIAMAKISAGEAEASTQALVDINYRSLGVDLAPLAKSSADFKMVDTYVRNTHGQTHTDFQLELLVRRKGGWGRFAQC
jgi:poly [ADP-ribose] polymerase